MIERLPIGEIKPNPKNPRKIKGDQWKLLMKSIKDFPEMLELRPLVIDETGMVLGGNMRLKALKELGHKEVPVIRVENLTQEKKDEFIIKDNISFGDWDWNVALAEFNTADLGDWGLPESTKWESLQVPTKLKDRFIFSPFSILKSYEKEWQNRKKEWRNIIGDEGESREDATIFNKGFSRSGVGRHENASSSLLDPVLAEMMTLWFCPENANILDTFAGDTVFGFVSTHQNGNRFTGIELRQEQVDLNNQRTTDSSNYICDDARNVLNHIQPNSQDFYFSCPPYYDLEIYSDNPKDASNQETYEDFIKLMETAFTAAISTLKENRFAVIVCGDIREKKTGFYYDFPSDVKRIFMNGGMRLYNEMILADPLGTAAIRANQSMKSRKVVKVHQNILVFFKGNPKKIQSLFPSLDAYDTEELIYESTDVEL